MDYSEEWGFKPDEELAGRLLLGEGWGAPPGSRMKPSPADDVNLGYLAGAAEVRRQAGSDFGDLAYPRAYHPPVRGGPPRGPLRGRSEKDRQRMVMYGRDGEGAVMRTPSPEYVPAGNGSPAHQPHSPPKGDRRDLAPGPSFFDHTFTSFPGGRDYGLPSMGHEQPSPHHGPLGHPSPQLSPHLLPSGILGPGPPSLRMPPSQFGGLGPPLFKDGFPSKNSPWGAPLASSVAPPVAPSVAPPVGWGPLEGARPVGPGKGAQRPPNPGSGGGKGRGRDGGSGKAPGEKPRQQPLGAAAVGGPANTLRWKKPTTQEIADNMDEFARTHNGSRLVQQKIESATDDEKDIIIAAILLDLPRHSSSVFGNYIVQRLLEFGSEKQLYAILASLRGKIMELSRDPYGCRVVQKALDAASRPGQLAILEEIRAISGTLELIKDQSGNHVMQKVIERLAVEDILFIPEAMHGHMHSIAVHLYGCRVAQRLFERVPVQLLENLYNELFPNFTELAQDQFGNYVLQHVAEFGSPPHRARATDLVCQNLAAMSCHKFASNVVEKVLTFGNASGHHRILDSALTIVPGEEPPVLRMMKDRYGNYVVQKLLDTAFGERRDALLRLLREHENTLRKFSYGKHILTRLEK